MDVAFGTVAGCVGWWPATSELTAVREVRPVSARILMATPSSQTLRERCTIKPAWLSFGLTPNMDRLVREGRELDRHCVQPVCTPTRTALMSGRCPGRFGRQTLLPSNLRAMPLGTLTFASALKSVGYRTHIAGKWHGSSSSRSTPCIPRSTLPRRAR